VATNRHVAGEGVALDLEVRFADGSSAPAERAFADPLHDFAFLRFDRKRAPDGLAALTLSSREPRAGEEVRMLGNNGGLASTVLTGIVSNLDAAWEQDPGVEYIQTSIASAGGSSGSPILDRFGAAIGLQAAHDDHTSYALPAVYLSRALASLRAGIVPARGTLGLRLRKADALDAVASGAVNPELARKLGWNPDALDTEPKAEVALVDGIVPDSPCDGKIGAGAVVLTVAGVPAGDLRAVEHALDERVDKEVAVVYCAAGVKGELKAVVANLNHDCIDKLVLFAGAAFQDIHFEFRSRSDVKREGVAVAHVEMGSAAEAADLRRDDVVVSIGGKPITGTEEFWKLVAETRNNERLILVIRRPSSFDSATRTIALVADRVWDPTRFLRRAPGGWVGAAPSK
jgi:S1-C subfamily serine protease